MRVRCPENLFFAFASLPPYIYKSDDSKITGIFSSFLNDAVQFWCAGKTNITYTEVGNGFGDLERHIVNNSADFIFPMPGRLKMKHFLGRPYIPISKFSYISVHNMSLNLKLHSHSHLIIMKTKQNLSVSDTLQILFEYANRYAYFRANNTVIRSVFSVNSKYREIRLRWVFFR